MENQKCMAIAIHFRAMRKFRERNTAKILREPRYFHTEMMQIPYLRGHISIFSRLRRQNRKSPKMYSYSYTKIDSQIPKNRDPEQKCIAIAIQKRSKRQNEN